MKDTLINRYGQGFQDGIPIGLGYLSVSFSFGVMAVSAGIPIWVAIVISMTNLTSAGQVAGIQTIMAMAGYLEIALTQLVINIRYALMSLSLSQKLQKGIGTLSRLFISFGITDEVFAVASTKPGKIGRRYMAGLITAPYLGWSLGTILGAVAGSILPAGIQSALGVAIYGMFLAIIIPPAKKSFPIFFVTALAVVLSCLFRWVPGLNQVSGGFVIIICSVVAATLGAAFFPEREEETLCND